MKNLATLFGAILSNWIRIAPKVFLGNFQASFGVNFRSQFWGKNEVNSIATQDTDQRISELEEPLSPVRSVARWNPPDDVSKFVLVISFIFFFLSLSLSLSFALYQYSHWLMSKAGMHCFQYSFMSPYTESAGWSPIPRHLLGRDVGRWHGILTWCTEVATFRKHFTEPMCVIDSGRDYVSRQLIDLLKKLWISQSLSGNPWIMAVHRFWNLELEIYFRYWPSFVLIWIFLAAAPPLVPRGHRGTGVWQAPSGSDSGLHRWRSRHYLGNSNHCGKCNRYIYGTWNFGTSICGGMGNCFIPRRERIRKGITEQV